MAKDLKKRKQRTNVLGEALRTAREAAHISQVPLSLDMKYDYNVVSSWENGSKPLYKEEWPRLCALIPGLQPTLVTKHKDELALGEGRKLKTRPTRLQPQVTIALQNVVAAKAPGVPLAEVASAMGMDYLSFWKMHKGDSNPTLSQLLQLADYFGVDTDVSLGRRPVDSVPYAHLAQRLNQEEGPVGPHTGH